MILFRLIILVQWKKATGAVMKKNRRKSTKGKAVSIGLDLRVDRRQMSIRKLTSVSDDVDYWKSRSPSDRLAYVEFLRLINYGENAVSGRLKRVFEIAEFRSR